MIKYANGLNVTLVVLVLFLLCWLGLLQYYGMPADVGAFGDQFGAVNALFSALALAGVIYTLIQQQQEMKAQRREFMNSRAYMLAYKQVELVNVMLEKAEQEKIFMHITIPDTTPLTFSLFNSFLMNDNPEEIKNVFELLKNRGKQHRSLLRVLANSCDLLVRLKKDGMNDEDANILFNTLKFNINNDVWSFIANLNHQKKKNPDLFKSYIKLYGESLERINRFNTIYHTIKKDTDDIDVQ